MSFNFKNRVRLGVEALEDRVLADAKLPIMPAALGNLAVVRTAVAPVSQVLTDMTAAVIPAKAATAAKDASAGWMYTAFTLINNSNATVAYSIKWGAGSWTSYTLAPHQGRTQYIGGLNQTATISYDKSFAPGYQDQEYTLTGTNITFPAGFYLTTPTPSYGAGTHYTFGNVSGGVQLYS
jgi:hypothetical protein